MEDSPEVSWPASFACAAAEKRKLYLSVEGDCQHLRLGSDLHMHGHAPTYTHTETLTGPPGNEEQTP